MDYNNPTFPHCDPRILHAPNECKYCDAHKDWQYLREMWGISFTGHDPKEGRSMLPCPSEYARPLSTINKWDGNVPYNNDGSINEDASMFEGKTVLHDSASRHVEIVDRKSLVSKLRKFLGIS